MLFGLCISFYIVAPNNTLVATIVSFVCMFISFVIIRLNENRIKSSAKFLPSIVKKVSEYENKDILLDDQN